MNTAAEWRKIFNESDHGGYVKVTYGTLIEFEDAIRREVSTELEALKSDNGLMINGITTAQNRLAQLDSELNEIQATFDLRWNADQRAIKMWQKAHPGKELTWPDHADLVVWLLECVDVMTDGER